MIIGVVGGIYAVLLSFVVIVVWQQFNAAEANAQNEASAIADLHHLSFAFPQPLRRRIADNLKAYAVSVVSVEFKAMATGRDPSEVRDLAVTTMNLIANWETKTPREANLRWPRCVISSTRGTNECATTNLLSRCCSGSPCGSARSS
ncbi:MAG: DUF4239 domain-containing protein [Candidatus Eremiobacteraeota bacterium]|nr:DUF4239 domain-containing protein [Candidatus Eremiobacteraeota bacterium]